MEILKMVNIKEKEFFILLMETNMMATSKMMNNKEKEFCIFLMEIKLKVNGKME